MSVNEVRPVISGLSSMGTGICGLGQDKARKNYSHSGYAGNPGGAGIEGRGWGDRPGAGSARPQAQGHKPFMLRPAPHLRLLDVK